MFFILLVRYEGVSSNDYFEDSNDIHRRSKHETSACADITVLPIL